MNDCTRTSALLDVYADDETSAETNALVHEHLQTCERCTRELQGILSLRAQLRSALGGEHASSALRGRIAAAVAERARPTFAGALRSWLAPASAAVVAFAIWITWGPPADPLVEAAVAEHVACALNGRAARLADAAAIERGYPAAMPWIRGGADAPHVVDAHTCGEQHTFSHVVFASEGARASILIAPKNTDAKPMAPVARLRGFDVSVVTTAKHVVYVIVQHGSAGDMREWRAAALERVGRYLEQLEGTL